MGWTLEDYYNTPKWFIETIRVKMNVDARHQEKLNSRLEGKAKGGRN